MTPTRAESATITHTVTAQDTAKALGSGDVDVLGTPALLAWCEEATCAVVDIPADSTSVGTKVTINHVAASPIGTVISATANVVLVAGRTISFEVEVFDGDGQLVAHGQIQRATIDRARFTERLAR